MGRPSPSLPLWLPLLHLGNLLYMSFQQEFDFIARRKASVVMASVQSCPRQKGRRWPVVLLSYLLGSLVEVLF